MIYVYLIFALVNYVCAYPNIILYIADDLGQAEFLGSSPGYDFSIINDPLKHNVKTPNIEKLSKMGMSYKQVWGATVCAPSRFMILSGKIIENSQVKGNNFVSQKTNFDLSFPNVLKKIGYNTAIIGKYGFGIPGDFYSADKMGFDYFYGYGTHVQAHYPFPRFVYRNSEIIQFSNNAHSSKQKCFDTNKCTFFPDLIQIESINYINSRDITKPFLLIWCPISTHVGKWDKNSILKSDVTNTFGIFKNFPWTSQLKGYAHSIDSIDRDIGQLLKTLENNKIENNTIILFMSDNGAYHVKNVMDFFGSTGGRKGNKGSMYEGGLSVPLIISYPIKIKYGHSYYPMAFHDIPKTLLDLIDAPVNVIQEFSKVDNNTVSIIGSPARKWLKTTNCGNIGTCKKSIMDISDWEHSLQKLIFDGISYSLYDIKLDPGELVNLIDNHSLISIENLMKNI